MAGAAEVDGEGEEQAFRRQVVMARGRKGRAMFIAIVSVYLVSVLSRWRCWWRAMDNGGGNNRAARSEV